MINYERKKIYSALRPPSGFQRFTFAGENQIMKFPTTKKIRIGVNENNDIIVNGSKISRVMSRRLDDYWNNNLDLCLAKTNGQPRFTVCRHYEHEEETCTKEVDIEFLDFKNKYLFCFGVCRNFSILEKLRNYRPKAVQELKYSFKTRAKLFKKPPTDQELKEKVDEYINKGGEVTTYEPEAEYGSESIYGTFLPENLISAYNEV